MELMVVVVIIGVLAAIAVPSYRRYLLRTQRSEAKIALLQLQTAEEKFYLQNNAFTDKVKDASPTGLGLPMTTETGKYAITVKLGDEAQTFEATAAPATGGGQTDDKECKSFTINNLGKRGIDGGSKDAQYCWR
jgi:type IV pilus assembly protein PilE